MKQVRGPIYVDISSDVSGCIPVYVTTEIRTNAILEIRNSTWETIVNQVWDPISDEFSDR